MQKRKTENIQKHKLAPKELHARLKQVIESEAMQKRFMAKAQRQSSLAALSDAKDFVLIDFMDKTLLNEAHF